MRPSFLVIGAMKAGTTSLYSYLDEHPEIFMPHKEVNFFSFGWDRGLAWYESLFTPAGPVEAVGEVSPSYTAYAGNVAERIAGVVPAVRMVYCLRDPVERTRAHYLHRVAGGRERRPFERALAETSWYVTCSRYVAWIERYLEHFDRSQLLLITSEDLRDRRGDTLDRVLAFLGLETGWRPRNIDRELHRTADKRAPRMWTRRAWRDRDFRLRVARKKPPVRWLLSKTPDVIRGNLSVEAEQRLRDELRPDVERLAAYMEPGFDGWGMLGR